MPLRIKWSQGKYLGVALLFLGVTGLLQALVVVPFAQYAVDVGSLYVVILIPIVSTVLLTYSSQILYESYAKSPKKKPFRGKAWVVKIREILQRELIRPLMIVILSFLVIFFIFYGIFSGLASVYSFVIAENVGTIGVLLVTVAIERRIVPPEPK